MTQPLDTPPPTFAIQIKPRRDYQAEASIGETLLEASDAVTQRLAKTISDFSRSVLEKIAIERPSNVSLEFGVNCGGTAGIPFITAGTVEANVTVTVEWNFDKNGSGG